MKLADKVALITGASNGIGAACVERFAALGARVALVDTDARAGQALAASLNVPGLFIEGSVTTAGFPAQAIAATVAHFGRLDILINNAGITHAAGFLDLTEADFDRVLAVNLKSYFVFGQAAARQMVAQQTAGVIVNMSSVNAILAIPDQIPYVVSKGGVNQLTRVMAIALAPYSIRVNAIGPGTIATELAKRAVLGSESSRRKVLARTPMKRLGEPDEVARVAAFLASDDASYLTGQTIYPDGGRLALNYTVAIDE